MQGAQRLDGEINAFRNHSSIFENTHSDFTRENKPFTLTEDHSPVIVYFL